MPDIVLDLLKYVFLAVLYIFVGRAVKAMYLDMRGEQAPAGRPAKRSAEPRTPPRKQKKAPRSVAVVEGDSHKGKTFELGDELIIGRGDKCHVALQDSYVSQSHARIYARGENYVIEDLGSTNGTYLNRRRITAPAELQRGDQIKIGKTVLELRK